MIQFTTIIENGVNPGERYKSLEYQLVLTADNAGALSYPSFLGSRSATEASLSAHIDALIPGLHIPAETRERAALFSLEYANIFSGGPAQTAALTAMLGAIETGDRAEAWFELRYGLNAAALSAVAREHFDEAQVFGLFQSSSPASMADVSGQESLLAMRMATLHGSEISSYETLYASQIAAAALDVNAISLRTKSNYGVVSTIDNALAPAIDRLVYDYTDLAHLAPDLLADLAGGVVLANPAIAAVWVAPDVAGDQGDAHTVDFSEAPARNDLIFGSIRINGPDDGAADTLRAGDGDDFIVGGRGADVIDGGSGEDTVSFLGTTRVVKLDLGQGAGNAGDAYGDTYLGVENVLGGTFDDVLVGNAVHNLLYGGGGNDLLVGADGSDDLIGGKGNDRIFGEALGQKDTLLNAVAQEDLTHGNTLVAGLGGDSGFGENALPPNDDGSSGAIDITGVFGEGGLDFFGTSYTQLYINNNGNITFSAPLSAYTPGQINAGAGNPIIAAFWADVDTRTSEGLTDNVYYDLDAEHGVFTVTWDEVGSYANHSTPSNSFQLELIDEGNGNFDIVFRYQEIGWTSGDASNGVVARAGYAAGNGDDYFELSQSGDDGEMRGLPDATGNTGIEGVFVFHVINGQVFDASDTIDGGAGVDRMTGGPGADLFVFHMGEANGDTVTDFNDVSGDRLKFEGYGEDATFAQIDSTHWQIGGEIITFLHAPVITGADYIIG